ncbi:SPOSA6832_03677 [Sporobolomyces salmonicolor]|uniref:SPOSA6832_03677-mRNA-1:cds n=1 Tax=Sporidiobolus salmonicolor TaxID=5005 RepID=A0A0D6EPZ5_SPOSA|nr:SPOSA6832_03677 [Sporobolomyces salmonicolor]
MKYQDWQASYIDYGGLKRLIKDRQARHRWDDADEADFIKALESELDKVVKFQESKIAELTEKITNYEQEVKDLIAHADERRQIKDASGPASESDGQDGQGLRNDEEQGDDEGDEASDTSDDDEFEDRFVELEEDLANVIADVHDLGELRGTSFPIWQSSRLTRSYYLGHFSHLNYTGFIKIVKKHDKRTGFTLKGQFMREFLEKRPFYKENYDALIVQLSRLYNLVRTRGNPVMGDSSAGGGQSAFVRQTTKYWERMEDKGASQEGQRTDGDDRVHPDNYVQLKLVILKHLPVLVFNPEKSFEAADAAISSIYFDNPDLDLYMGRLEKTEGAEAIRLRWYGDMGVKQIFVGRQLSPSLAAVALTALPPAQVERKTHREDWTGEKSVKARFPIAEHLVNDYLAGKHTMDATFEEIRKKGKKSDKEIDGMIKLAREVQAAIKHKNLQPVMRTFYNRTAFQLPGDARVRISFDTQLSLIREDNWDGVTRSGDNWRRTDIGIDWPFPQLPEGDKELFPYGVLEVKLQTQMGQEPPEWVRELVSSHLVEAVPKFSKFIHGCATLMPNRVDLVPFWLPQMETDIRKPATRKAQIERPSASHSNTASATPSDARSSEHEAVQYTEPVSDDEDADDDRLVATTNDEAGWADLPPDAAAEAKKYRDEQAKLRTGPAGHSARSHLQAARAAPKQRELFPKLTPANLSKLLESRYETDRHRGLNERQAPSNAAVTGASDATGNPSGISLRPGRIEYVSSFRAGEGKKIAIPVRVEPKVFYANERTTLAWIEFSVIISAIGIGILSFSDPHDDVALAAAASFTTVALLAILYTAYTYVWRVASIRARRAVSYHDWIGPSALCGVLLLAVIVNFSLRLKEGF